MRLRPQVIEVQRPVVDAVPQQGMSRLELLRYLGAGLAGIVGITAFSQTPPGRAITRQVFGEGSDSATLPETPTPRIAGTLGYFHAMFEVNSPQSVADCAAAGVTHSINYGSFSWDAADPSTPLGAAHQRYGLKTFVNVEWPYLRCDAHGIGYLTDEEAVKTIVRRAAGSKLTAGYWTKDDICSHVQGGEVQVVQHLRTLIRTIDPDPSHYIMPGYGETFSTYVDYAAGVGDMICFYPYPAYSQGPAREMARILSILRQRTPAGQPLPPWIGTYQCFATPPQRPVLGAAAIVPGVAAYLTDGAVGIAGFGWDPPLNEVFTASNNATLRAIPGAVSQYLRANLSTLLGNQHAAGV